MSVSINLSIISSEDDNFHIPVQLVTSSDANRMLRELHDGGVIAPDEWASKTGEKSYLGINLNNASKHTEEDKHVFFFFCFNVICTFS